MTTNHARRERLLLVEALETAGPDAPTLCEGWTTRDLAAHLVIRERRPDAAAGIMVKPLAARLLRVQGEYAARPYPELLELIRSGPPRTSLFAIPGADELANAVEFFVHGEDVRRAVDDWQPRALGEDFSELLWRRTARAASLNARRSPVGLVLRRPDGQTAVARKGAPVVTATGEPAELLLLSMGRQSRAAVTLEGEASAVERLRQARLGA